MDEKWEKEAAPAQSADPRVRIHLCQKRTKHISGVRRTKDRILDIGWALRQRDLGPGPAQLYTSYNWTSFLIQKPLSLFLGVLV